MLGVKCLKIIRDEFEPMRGFMHNLYKIILSIYMKKMKDHGITLKLEFRIHAA